MKSQLNDEQVHELLYQALETELGGVQVYQTAVSCAVNEDLKEEWEKYLEQTRHHVEVVTGVLEGLGLDPKKSTPGRKVVGHIGSSLVSAMEMAKKAGPEAAQLVAAECVVLAETKDHQNWELIGQVAEGAGKGDLSRLLKKAHDEVENEEDEHLYHTAGWSRELWIESLGLAAVLPPPEEVKKVETAIGAARAKQDREELL
jgi:ferritin-like metal-binding protein YciE